MNAIKNIYSFKDLEYFLDHYNCSVEKIVYVEFIIYKFIKKELLISYNIVQNKNELIQEIERIIRKLNGILNDFINSEKYEICQAISNVIKQLKKEYNL